MFFGQDIGVPIDLLSWLGLVAGALSTLAYLPYLRDTALGKTLPQRSSWLIWSVLGTIAFFSQAYEGAYDSLWFAGVQVSGTITVFVMSFFVGKGAFLSRSDYVVLALAAFGLFLWYQTETATYALAITISISLLGGCVTVAKAYRAPHSETTAMWATSLAAACCAVLSVGAFDPILLAYPAYLCALNCAIVVAIYLGRIRDQRARPRTASKAAPCQAQTS